MNRRPDARAARGFTLVEVLVSLTILSMVLALLFTGLRMGGRSLQAVELRTAESEQMFQAQHLLRDLLEQIQPYMESDAAGRKQLVFAGDQRSLSFVAPATRNLGWAGLMHYRLELRPAQDPSGSSVLAMAYWPSGVATPDAAQEVVLMPVTAASRFTYYGRDESGRTGWHSQWRHRQALPEGISLSHEPDPAPDAAAPPPDLYAVTRGSWYGQER